MVLPVLDGQLPALTVAAAGGYRLELDGSRHGGDGAFDAVFRRRGSAGQPVAPLPAAEPGS